MIVEIISVGTELLMGQVANTDAQYIASRISPLGCQIFHHTTVGDNPERLTEAVHRAINRADTVIFTGGLGPTDDDLTKETVAAALGLVCVPNEKELARLKERLCNPGHPMAPNNLKQANFPKSARILLNPNGTAPGCIMESNHKAAILLPGPPRELEPMVDASVVPYLEERCGFRLHSREIRILGMGESDVTYRLRELIENQTNPTLAPYIKPGEVTLRVTAKCQTHEEGEALVAPMVTKIQEILGDAVYSTDGKSLAELVSAALHAKKQTVAVAESLTGGLLSNALVEIPGSSAIFLEGEVTYSNDAKIRRLGVRPETIERFGAVSRECALEMACGIRASANADYALATTGFAGPDGDDVGLVYVAFASKDETEVCELHLWGNRARIRLSAAMNALNLMRRKVCT